MAMTANKITVSIIRAAAKIMTAHAKILMPFCLFMSLASRITIYRGLEGRMIDADIISVKSPTL